MGKVAGAVTAGFTHASDWTLSADFTSVCREP